MGARDQLVLAAPGMTFVSRDEATALLGRLDLEMFEEEEADDAARQRQALAWSST